tara:strand:+ start:593 stop:907 length:315 start_codon:yes stop_codon:yes gene_type:complete
MKGFIMNTTIKKDKYQQQEDLLKELKQRLENSWSGFTQVVEELEEFQYTYEEEVGTLKNQIGHRLDNFYTNELDELKYEAEVLQGKIQEAIDKFVNKFNLKDEV